MAPIYARHRSPLLMAQGTTENCSYIVSDILGALTNGSICRGLEADRWCCGLCTIRLNNSTLQQVLACIKHLNACGRWRDARTVTRSGIAVVDSGVSGMGFRRWHWQIQLSAGRYLLGSGSDRCAGDREYDEFVRPSLAEKSGPRRSGKIQNSLYNMYTARSAALAKDFSMRDP